MTDETVQAVDPAAPQTFVHPQTGETIVVDGTSALSQAGTAAPAAEPSVLAQAADAAKDAAVKSIEDSVKAEVETIKDKVVAKADEVKEDLKADVEAGVVEGESVLEKVEDEAEKIIHEVEAEAGALVDKVKGFFKKTPAAPAEAPVVTEPASDTPKAA